MGSWNGQDAVARLAQLPTTTTAPTVTDESVRRARARTILGAQLKRGTSSTFTSGPRGTSAAVVQPKTILGG